MIQLPDAGDGSRRARRRGSDRRPRPPRRRPRLGGQAIAVGLALLVVLGAIGYVAVGFLGDDGDDPSGSGTEVAPVVGAEASSLVVLTDDAGAVVGITVLAPSASGEGGSIVHVPPGAMVEVPSFGLSSLFEAAAEGSTALLRTSLENLLGVPFDSSVVLDPASVSALVAPAGSLEVTLDEAVSQQAASGRIEVVFPAGTQSIAAADAPRFLAAFGDGTQLQRIVRHQAFWTAFLAAVDAGSLEAPSQEIAALAAGPVRHHVLPVEAVSGTTGVDELYRVPGDELVALVRRLFPSATPATASGERIRVQVLNGVGTPGLAQQVSPLLVPAGAQVTLSDNADRFDYAVTQVVYYDDARLADAEAVREALGVGELVKSQAELEVVDVTVVIGADFVQARAGSNPAPSEGAAP